MTVEMALTLPDIVEYQLPDIVRESANSQFVSFVKRYYEWAVQTGQPTEFIHNLIKYRDIDTTTPDFKTRILSSLLSDLPLTTAADRSIITKHLKQFLASKGSSESFKYIMNAVYGETIDLEWNSEKLLRASANSYNRKAQVVIESLSPWTNVEGATITQIGQNVSTATIISCTTTTFDNTILNWLQLDPTSVAGDANGNAFTPGASVEVLHSNIDRSMTRVTEYYTPISVTNNSIQFSAVTETPRPYIGLIVRQLNSTFRVVITDFVSRYQGTGYTVVTLSTTTGTPNTFVPGNELYIVPVSLENSVYTKSNFETGFVSNSITDVVIETQGTSYVPGQQVKFVGGNGQLVDGYISEVTSGGIDTISINNKGTGYTIGDKLNFINEGSPGALSATAEVSAIDGIGATIQTVSELNTFSIVNGGYNFAVNDEIELSTGIVVAGTPAARLRVTSVASTWLLQGINVTNSGSGYPLYTKIALIDTTVQPYANMAGFSAIPTISAGGISSISITTPPTSPNANMTVIANGYGASMTAIVAGGLFTGVVVNNVGVNYVNPAISIIGVGTGASAVPVVSNGTITGVMVISGGAGYTTPPNIVIYEKNGSGFAATPLIQNQTTGKGPITGLSIITNGRGLYTSLPYCFGNKSITRIGSGYGAVLALDFRLNSTNIINNGSSYRSITTDVPGIGSGAVLIPTISNGVISSIRRNTPSLGATPYTYASVIVNSTTGIGFVGKCIISGGVIPSIQIINGGSGYLTSDTVTIMGDGSGESFDLLGVGNLANGRITNISVINGGTNYYYGTTIQYPASIGAITGSFTPIINNGVISSVNIVSGGSGYLQSDVLAVLGGAKAVLSATSNGIGLISGYNITDNGFGYYSTSEITPINISASIGSGALFLPTIDANGTIQSVKVITGGAGYTNTSTISVTGGYGSLFPSIIPTQAVLQPIVFNGIITDVLVLNGGLNYKYGTSAIVLGDGINASVIPTVETGITNADVILGGSNYPSTTTIIVTDPTGTGADIRPTIINGVITSLTISNKGVNYTNPLLSISNFGLGTGASIVARSIRNISGVNIISAGSGFNKADLLIIGDGHNAQASLITGSNGSIDTITIPYVGNGYTSTPNVIITDTSGYGSISAIKITTPGSGYTQTPIVQIKDKYNSVGGLIGYGAKLYCSGATIGGVRNILFNNNGARYNDLPVPIFPLIATLDTNTEFKIGEQITIRTGVYKDIISTNFILLENGDFLNFEDATRSIKDLDSTMFDIGETATVLDFDFERNQIILDSSYDIFFLNSEDGLKISSENDINLVDQASTSVGVGDVIIGSKSKVASTIKFINRASGKCVKGGNGWSGMAYSSDTGMLNNKKSVVADNQRYQDYAYVIKAGLSLKKYEKLIKETVHPAGFMMFGDVGTQTNIDFNILNEIGYNALTTILYIFSVSAIYQAGPEWSYMSDIFGDISKFKFKFLPISFVSNFTIFQTSDVLYNTYNNYNAPALLSPYVSSWSISNATQIVTNFSMAPNNTISLTKVGDNNTLSSSSVFNTFSMHQGDTVTAEFFVAKQINPQSFLQVGLGTTILNINLDTGTYVSSVAPLDIIDMGDYWFIRIAYTDPSVPSATTISSSVSIVPAAGFTSNIAITNSAAIGQVEISEVIVKNITGLSSNPQIIRATNSKYIPTRFNICDTEADIFLLKGMIGNVMNGTIGSFITSVIGGTSIYNISGNVSSGSVSSYGTLLGPGGTFAYGISNTNTNGVVGNSSTTSNVSTSGNGSVGTVGSATSTIMLVGNASSGIVNTTNSNFMLQNTITTGSVGILTKV